MGHVECERSIRSDAFSFEYREDASDISIRTDLESLFGEYDFAVPLSRWELLFVSDEYGVSHLVSPYDREPMTIKCQRAIQKRKDSLKSTNREDAEYKCVCSLETQLTTASAGDMVFWTSPPGPKEDGYGKYGFFFVGQICAEKDTPHQKRISITAIHIDNQSVAQCNDSISLLTGESVYFSTAEDCIRNPKLISSIDEDKIKYVLSEIFHFVLDEERQKLFTDVMHMVKPYIDSFIQLNKQDISKRKIQKGFWALRNYVISLRDDLIDSLEHRKRNPLPSVNTFDKFIPFEALVHHFGSKPPPLVAGSCGSTGSNTPFKSSNIFNSLSSLFSLFSPEQSENFTCPRCERESVTPVGDTCPHCGLTKDEAQEKGFMTC